MPTFLANLRGKVEFTVLLAAIIIAGGLWGFVELMEVARDAAPHGFDTQILLAFRTPGDPSTPIGPFWMEDVMRDITSLGGGAILVAIVTVTIIYLLITRRIATALFVFVAITGGQALNGLLKLGIDRPRPELVSHLVNVHTLSFPSSHAMMSAVTFLTLGTLLARRMTGRATKIYVLFVAVLLTFLVGLSRIYLGVHWPSDVLAGWCAGSAWAMLCWLVGRWFLRQGTPEDAASGPS
ncbi:MULTISPECIES: phosphatase PAP2 family protein [unclassified Mesorhizobium]|uniref:phosphatase PAP2 family protein n=1 Tax=unclassified Mesorhizobium TaxID=325217 RepID=UPI0030155F60